MIKIRILGTLDEDTREALITLLKEAGFGDAIDAGHAIVEEEAEAGVGEGEFGNDADVNFEDEVCVVVLTPECDDDTELEGEVKNAVGAGCRIVGVWPRNPAPSSAPTMIDDYGSCVPWEAGRLREAVVHGSAEPVRLDANSKPRDPIKIKHNKC